MVLITEGFLEVAIEYWPEWDLNPEPLNFVVCMYVYIYMYITNLLRHEQVCLMMFKERYSFERYFFHHWA